MSTENQNTALETVKKDISTQVLAKVDAFQKAGELKLPKDYSPENALKSAYLILSETKNQSGKLALDVCTKESIANALLKMVVWGLSPMKKQCDFIMYGNKLNCDIEYTGNIALAKRFGGLKNIKGKAVFEGDDFEFETDPETGRDKLKKHVRTLKSMGSKNVIGAYAILEMNDGTKDMEVMSMEQIKDAWNQGANKGNSPAHKNFPDQMSIKTVINRACKPLIRTSNDAILYTETDGDGERTIDIAAEDVKHEIREKANKEEIGFDYKGVEDAKIVNDELSDEDREAAMGDAERFASHAEEPAKPPF